LKPESGVLYRDGRVPAKEESRETKQQQYEGRHEPRFLVYIALKVKRLEADGVLANDRAERALLLDRRKP
jgi:hypothetical protein